ncbi:MAG: TIGR01906 family membrane protein [Erysipelotrichaceae bacterium]|nr:TIGR01906 family membrane protein [Erysipelotrichaceae bacterium]
MQTTNYKNIIYIILSVSFILFSLLLSIHFWSFNEKFYKSEHSKLTLYGKSIAEHIGITDDDLDELTHFTLSYLNDPDASLDKQMNIKGEMREVFTDDEKAHMVDVRYLNLIANKLLVISFVICVVLIALIVIRGLSFSELFTVYKKVLIYVAVFIAAVSIWIIIDFDSFWTFFHHIFFAGNDLWLLDLRKDVLIMIVPPEFFNHLVIMIVLSFVGLICTSFGALYLFKGRSVH